MVEGEGVMLCMDFPARPGERAVEQEAVERPFLEHPACHGQGDEGQLEEEVRKGGRKEG